MPLTQSVGSSYSGCAPLQNFAAHVYYDTTRQGTYLELAGTGLCDDTLFVGGTVVMKNRPINLPKFVPKAYLDGNSVTANYYQPYQVQYSLPQAVFNGDYWGVVVPSNKPFTVDIEMDPMYVRSGACFVDPTKPFLGSWATVASTLNTGFGARWATTIPFEYPYQTLGVPTPIPTATPIPTPTPSPSPTATPSPTPTPLPTASPTATPVPTPYVCNNANGVCNSVAQSGCCTGLTCKQVYGQAQGFGMCVSTAACTLAGQACIANPIDTCCSGLACTAGTCQSNVAAQTGLESFFLDGSSILQAWWAGSDAGAYTFAFLYAQPGSTLSASRALSLAGAGGYTNYYVVSQELPYTPADNATGKITLNPVPTTLEMSSSGRIKVTYRVQLTTFEKFGFNVTENPSHKMPIHDAAQAMQNLFTTGLTNLNPLATPVPSTTQWVQSCYGNLVYPCPMGGTCPAGWTQSTQACTGGGIKTSCLMKAVTLTCVMNPTLANCPAGSTGFYKIYPFAGQCS